MNRRLDVEKAVQAVGVILRREGKRATRLRILKLLYIADRECLERTGSFLLGSKVIAMKHGPLHSEVLDLINGAHAGEPYWSRFFGNENKYVVLSNEPDVGRLSRKEVALLNEVVDERQGLDDWEVVDETHSFHEWLKNYPDRTERTSYPISLDDLIDAVGRHEDADAIRQDIADDDIYDRYFAGLTK
jgi:uncharacterized phage-associated protein